MGGNCSGANEHRDTVLPSIVQVDGAATTPGLGSNDHKRLPLSALNASRHLAQIAADGKFASSVNPRFDHCGRYLNFGIRLRRL